MAPSTDKPPRFSVHKRAAKRISDGHPWVFANELSVPARELPAGGAVDIRAPDGRFLGRGYANPNSLVAVRLCTRDKAQHIDLPGFWAQRLREAVALRATVLPGADAVRLVHGEADGCPGLVLDRYGDLVVVQPRSLGVEQRLDVIEEALHDVLPEVTSGLIRRDVRVRSREGLPAEGVDTWFGEPPEHVDITEEGTPFRVDPRTGPGTGHSLLHRDNRSFAAPFFKGQSVLDVYAGTGAWGLRALTAGAERATFIDKVEARCQAIHDNAELAGVGDRIDIFHDEARKTLIGMLTQGHRFGAVILDPPPFAKTKKAAGSALKGYREINALAMQLLTPGGVLLTSTSSQVIFEDRFVEALNQAASDAGRRLKLLRRGEAAPDHPLVPAMPEGRMLKHYALQVLTEV